MDSTAAHLLHGEPMSVSWGVSGHMDYANHRSSMAADLRTLNIDITVFCFQSSSEPTAEWAGFASASDQVCV